MAYLVVNMEGQEYICDSKPIRAGHIKSDDFSIYYKYYEEDDIVIGTNDDGEKFLGSFQDLSYWIFGASNDIALLPKGMIESIIGKALTWEDAPVYNNGTDVLKLLEIYGI